ncbi:centromere protein U isoform X2 [Danio aesculapii]|uniref:centromere protein U isoform X2 n=1 Tax=Danio aesculapii TaxID=1142201 RepID=UPI0024BFC062|nr:centromere protein U isoform X2 [Danio aesculapii]
MSRMAKTLKAVQRELQSAKQNNVGTADSPQPLDISSIEKASFFQGEQYSPHGNPLHSTALEEDPSPGPEHNQRSAPQKTGQPRTKKNAQTASKAVNSNTASKENQEPVNQAAKSVGKVKSKTMATTSEGAEKKRASIPASSPSKKAGKVQRSPKETSPTPRATQNQRRPSLSSEDLTDEDESFNPGKGNSKGTKRRSSSLRLSGHKQKRKSSSSSDRAGPSKKPRDLRNPIDLDVVLDAFQEFVTEYKQTLNSDPVRRSVEAFSRSFEEQLTEIINRAINQKRTRLVEANNELIKGKTQLQKLQKDVDEMEQRFKALTEGSSLLSNLKELNRKYLKHRSTHPDELEMFGTSCMPAMLMEARCIMGAEHQLKTVNDHLQQVLGATEN